MPNMPTNLPTYIYSVGSTYQCQFGCRISKMVGKKSTYSKEIIVFCAVILPITKKSNMYQYLKCTAILISIQNVEKY